jgi:hypothetical protein
MISQYSNPVDIDREFWEDLERAKYWLNKKHRAISNRMKVYDGAWEVECHRREYYMSDICYYTSQKTGNKWMTYILSKRANDGDIHFYSRYILYSFTERYMTIMIPLMVAEEDEDGDLKSVSKVVTVYTSHMFQRMADPYRLGVDMSDRVKVIRNFVEFVAEGWSDTRPPRDGERHTQILMRTPASWLRGHTVDIEDRRVIIYRTFYTDRSMTPRQLRDVKSFRKFADEKIKECYK